MIFAILSVTIRRITVRRVTVGHEHDVLFHILTVGRRQQSVGPLQRGLPIRTTIGAQTINSTGYARCSVSEVRHRARRRREGDQCHLDILILAGSLILRRQQLFRHAVDGSFRNLKTSLATHPVAHGTGGVEHHDDVGRGHGRLRRAGLRAGHVQ